MVEVARADMGAETSRLDATKAVSNGKPAEVAREIADHCEKNKLEAFTELWDSIQKTRDEEYDKELCNADKLCNADIMSTLKKAMKRQDPPEWRRKGVEIARTFFYLQRARHALEKMDFITYLLVSTLNENEDDEEDDGNRQDKEEKEEKEKNIQLDAAKTIHEMVEYPELLKMVRSDRHYTSVLNFLSVVLNQVKEAREIVTDTFVKLSRSEEQDTLVKLMEDSVGDVLESFFKTVEYRATADEDDEKTVTRNISALSNCAHTLGTLIKYKHPVRIHKPRIVEVFKHIVDTERRSISPHGIRLLAEMSRLLYWICRGSKDVMATLQEASDSLDDVLMLLKDVWEICCTLHEANGSDVDLSRKAKPDPDDMKSYHEMCLCHMNCLLWVLLPESKIRWKFKKLELTRLHLAFDLRNPEFLTVVLSTVRHLADFPPAQECHDLIRFFGEQLLVLLSLMQKGTITDLSVVTLHLDAMSIVAMQREMQEMFAEYDASAALDAALTKLPREQVKRHELSVLLTKAQVAMHPSHRLRWVSRNCSPEPYCYPPREKFKEHLEHVAAKSSDVSFKTIATFLLITFQEEDFKKPLAEIETMFKTCFEYWQEHTTARYEYEKVALESQASNGARQPERLRPLRELLLCAIRRREERRALTSMETLNYCKPYECVFALSLFSRLALEPKFKKLFYDTALHSLLGCVCMGIWPEAREAAATLANLMWLPDLHEERLVCWLKLDGPQCIMLDAANVLIPVKKGNPKAADIGKGMYQSMWGVQFVEGSCVTLHPDGLTTKNVPGILTSASPSSTFVHTSREPYQWLDESAPDAENFSVTCWFYWPLSQSKEKVEKVFLQAKHDPLPQVYLDCNQDPEGPIWTITTDKRQTKKLKTPRLNPGWHMLSIVSSTKTNEDSFDGTRFYLDGWCKELKGHRIKNEFYMVGNGKDGYRPFGLITDFRIYARALSSDDISKMVHAKDTEQHPDQIVRRLASMGAADILAQRLDVPDSAAECLRALGSLATLQSQRAKIYSICGRQVLKMLDSPLHMIRRQAARLLSNIT